MLKTRITERFGLKYPVMSAPMSRHSGGTLAGAVARAGGVGLFGGISPAGDDWLRGEIRLARTLGGDHPFGVGFITHLLPVFPGLFDVTIEERVPVISFSFADPTPWVGRAKESGATVVCQVQSVSSAKQAVDAGADILVVQGNEAGGHTGRSNLMPLLLRILQDYPSLPVLAAGGIASGAGLASVLAAGADGVWMGTAFLATHECLEVSDAYKRKVVEAGSEDTRFTKVYDILDEAAFGIPPWPSQIGGRAITNSFLNEWHGSEESLQAEAETVTQQYRQYLTENDVDKTAVWAGESVDFVNEVRAAATVIETVCSEAERLLENLQQR